MLRGIDLSCTKIGDRGVQALAEVLESESTLINLNLSKNNISDVGGQALGKALETNQVSLEFTNYGNFYRRGKRESIYSGSKS